MNTSSKFIVAIHILTLLEVRRLAKGEVDVVKSEFMSESVNTNPVVIRRILGLLRKAGLVTSQKGPVGGTWLTRPAEQISLLQVYQAVEEGALFHLHYNEPNMQCPIGANIQDSLSDTFKAAETAMKNTLAQKTIGDVARSIAKAAGIDKMMAKGMSLEDIESGFRALTRKP